MKPTGQRSAGAVSSQYRILGHLATGGMAELYLARAMAASGRDRYVVLKRITADHARNHRFVTMFLDEARLAAQLHHPNIAQVHDIGRIADSYFFTMEYVHGENVRELLHRVAGRKAQLPLAHALAIAIGAAAGLHYAHDKRGHDRQPLDIVHRDVSPSNLMVSYAGEVKVVDFGIAKAADRMTETRSGAVKGKVAYMSPEQCTGQLLDRRSDIFSLGIVLYEMATMTRLFKHATDFETMNHIVNLPVPPPTSRRPDLPRGLEDIILRALAHRPEDRYATAGELQVALEQLARRERLDVTAAPLGAHIHELFGERPEPWFALEATADPDDIITVEPPELDPPTEKRSLALDVLALSDWQPDPLDDVVAPPPPVSPLALAPVVAAPDPIATAVKASRTRTAPSSMPPPPAAPMVRPARPADADPFDAPTNVVAHDPPRASAVDALLAEPAGEASWRSGAELTSWPVAPAASIAPGRRWRSWLAVAITAIAVVVVGARLMPRAGRDGVSGAPDEPPRSPSTTRPVAEPAAAITPAAAPAAAVTATPVLAPPTATPVVAPPPVMPVVAPPPVMPVVAPPVEVAAPARSPAVPSAQPPSAAAAATDVAADDVAEVDAPPPPPGAIKPRPRAPRPPRPPRVVAPAPVTCGDAMGIYPPCE